MSALLDQGVYIDATTDDRVRHVSDMLLLCEMVFYVTFTYSSPSNLVVRLPLSEEGD